ncbi:MAG: hypothetical protein QOF81_752 [Acidimicrobiaceae bacterium]|nr:hypothetical protein [Acidimicrobiaceae bacterium]
MPVGAVPVGAGGEGCDGSGAGCAGAPGAVPVERASDEELGRYRDTIDAWADHEAATNPLIGAVERDRSLSRWYVRMHGEEKAVITLWLTLGQRTLHYESYFMPAPVEQRAECYEYLLKANLALFGMRFAIGAEDALYLVGQMPLSAVDGAELDRITGSAYAYSERFFRPAMKLGFGAKFGR